MMVVIGGYGSGRRTFVCEKLGFTLTDIGKLSDTSCAVLFIDNDLALSFLTQREVLLPLILQKEVIICTEAGCGIVPAEEEQNLLREAYGLLNRVCAANADTVVRMCCGIPQVLKGELVL